MGFIRPATPAEVSHVARNLRPEDEAEVRAYCGLDPAIAVPAAAANSTVLWSVCADDGEVGGIWGTQPVFGCPDIGWVWMLFTPLLWEHRWDFAINCRSYLPQAFEHYPVLTNYVDERNTLHVKWLRYMGATFTNRIERFGAEGRPFLEFYLFKD